MWSRLDNLKVVKLGYENFPNIQSLILAQKFKEKFFKEKKKRPNLPRMIIRDCLVLQKKKKKKI